MVFLGYVSLIFATMGLLTHQSNAIAVDASSSDLAARTTDAAQTYQDASWIWTSEGQIIASRAFRRTYVAASNAKVARFGLCQASSDNEYTFYVNDETIGTGSDWTQAQMFYVDLVERVNFFAFDAVNVGGPAGLLVACRIFYSDGTIDTLLTDTTWDTIDEAPPTNFQSPYYFEDTTSTWVAATNLGKYGSLPWSNLVNAPAFPPVVGLASSNWIWSASGDSFPIETRPFRYSFCIPGGKTAKYAIILLTADNEFTLYVDGNLVGYGDDWELGYRYVVPITSSSIVFAVAANNEAPQGTPNPAGVIGTIQIVYSDATWDTIVTDGTWKTIDSAPPVGFEQSGFDDSTWGDATVVGAYGTNAWGSNVVVPPI